MFYYIILFYFNPPNFVGGMEEEGQNKFERDSEFSGGSRRNVGRQVCFITLFCVFFKSPKSIGGMEGDINWMVQLDQSRYCIITCLSSSIPPTFSSDIRVSPKFNLYCASIPPRNVGRPMNINLYGLCL